MQRVVEQPQHRVAEARLQDVRRPTEDVVLAEPDRVEVLLDRLAHLGESNGTSFSTQSS
jgi:hypothetical protein